MDSKNKDIKYKFALIEGSEKLINIKSVSEENRKQYKYICPNCGKELIPALGNKNVHHFRHKDDEVCDPNGYLHALAERLFIERFYSNKPLNIILEQKIKCSEYEECSNIWPVCSGDYTEGESIMSVDDYSCIRYSIRKCNLKKYYDTCIREKEIGDFRADILLLDSTGKHQPFLVEIFVTHKCTPEKLSSGLRILEIKIESEQDANDLLTNDIIEGEIFNFKIPEKKMKLQCKGKTNVFHLFVSAKNYFNEIDTVCNKITNYHIKGSVLEVQFDDSWGSFSFYQFAVNNGFKVRTCHLCKYYKDSILGNVCIRYKTKGTPHRPKHLFANICSYFKQEEKAETDGLNVLYIEEDEDKKDLMSNYRNQYDIDVAELLNKCVIAFEGKKLKFKLDNCTDSFYVSDYYQKFEKKSNSVVFSSADTNNAQHLIMVFGRDDEYMRILDNKIRTIYVYKEVVDCSDNEICIKEDVLKENFVNFKKTEPKECFDSKPVNIHSETYLRYYYEPTGEPDISSFTFDNKEDSTKADGLKEQETIEEKDVKKEPEELSEFDKNKPYYQKILEGVLNAFKTLYKEGKVRLQLPNELPFEMQYKYPFCNVVVFPENLYYSLVFNENNNLLGKQLIIRFECDEKRIDNGLSDQKEIVILIDKDGGNVLEDNCICPKEGKIIYRNF